jgi:hypothetical protein
MTVDSWCRTAFLFISSQPACRLHELEGFTVGEIKTTMYDAAALKLDINKISAQLNCWFGPSSPMSVDARREGRSYFEEISKLSRHFGILVQQIAGKSPHADGFYADCLELLHKLTASVEADRERIEESYVKAFGDFCSKVALANHMDCMSLVVTD